MASLLRIFLLFLAFSTSFDLCFSRRVNLRTEDANLKHLLQPRNLTPSTAFDPSKAVQLSWHPRAFLYKDFLSAEECDHLISLAHGKLEKSLVVGDSGEGIVSRGRTSSGMFLNRGQDEIISKIEERISVWTFLPKENGENMQILHYGVNEKYEPHYDYFNDEAMLAFGGHRIATVLMYLSNITQGGETIFPDSELKGTQAEDDTWSDCAQTGYAVKPVKGSALLFFNLHPNARPDASSFHGGCKVLEGEKWSATKWIRVKTYDKTKSDGECTDEDDNCIHWSAIGECDRNSVFMMGTPDYYGTCRKSCGVC